MVRGQALTLKKSKVICVASTIYNSRTLGGVKTTDLSEGP